ncbi:hypothetical protein M3J09_000665 [Ascochyta lentis]
MRNRTHLYRTSEKEVSEHRIHSQVVGVNQLVAEASTPFLSQLIVSKLQASSAGLRFLCPKQAACMQAQIPGFLGASTASLELYQPRNEQSITGSLLCATWRAGDRITLVIGDRVLAKFSWTAGTT